MLGAFAPSILFNIKGITMKLYNVAFRLKIEGFCESCRARVITDENPEDIKVAVLKQYGSEDGNVRLDGNVTVTEIDELGSVHQSSF